MQYHPTIHQILLETKLFNRISNAKGKIKIFAGWKRVFV